MKLLKMLVLFLVMTALTATAMAEVTYVPFTKTELEGMSLHLPLGLADDDDVTYSDGLITINVDNSKVDWAALAAQADEFDEVLLDIEYHRGGYTQSALFGQKMGSADWRTDKIKPALQEVRDYIVNVFGTYMSDWCSGSWKVADYDAMSDTVTPAEYTGMDAMVFMVVDYEVNGDKSSAVDQTKYALIKLDYSSTASVKAEAKKVPSARIVMDEAAMSVENPQSYPTYGKAVYKLDGDFPNNEVTTKILAPSDAGYYAFSQYDTPQALDDDNGFMYSVACRDESCTSEIITVFWFDEDGDYKYAESITIEMTVGDPKPWLYYEMEYLNRGEDNAEWAGVRDLNIAQVDAYVTKNGEKASGTYITVSYDDMEYGRLLTYAEDEISQKSEDMTVYQAVAAVEAPSEAAYGLSWGIEEREALGNRLTTDDPSNSYRTMDRLLKEMPVDDPYGYVEIKNKKAYFEYDLFREVTYEDAPGLSVYLDAQGTGIGDGITEMIDWYKQDGEFIRRDWYTIQFKPLASTSENTVLTAQPSSVNSPTLVYETAANGVDYKLQVRIYPQISEEGTQIHYELTLLNAYGAEVPLSELGKKASLLIPYQTADGADDPNVSYAIGHYTSENKSQESFSELGATITRTDAGLLVTIDSLSPFVLSWEETGAAGALPATGDSSMMMAWLALAACSVAVLAMIARRKREA